MSDCIETDILYENALARPADVADWGMEGDGIASFPRGKMRQESLRPREAGQAGNIVHWCPLTFPDNISISWEFQPLTEPGLGILFFSALGMNGEDILSAGLAERNGPYEQYHHGDFNALHVSYFRRNPSENEFQICNLHKSCGFPLVAQGADPSRPRVSLRTPIASRWLSAALVFRFTWVTKRRISPFSHGKTTACPTGPFWVRAR